MWTSVTIPVQMGDLSMPVEDTQLSTEEGRLNTFLEKRWPETAPVFSKDLARAGFYYTGHDFEVECFQCHVRYSNWTFGEIALRKHKELNGNCPFVRGLSGILPASFRATDHKLPFGNGYQDTVDRGRPPPALRSMSNKSQSYRTVWQDNHLSLVRESERLKTYESWPVAYIRPQDLARAGFVYLKSGDRVQCVYCEGIVGSWDVGDDPLQEHSRHFPSCPFITGTDHTNISIEDEIRRRSSIENGRPLNNRGFDVCGRYNMDLQSFRPERVSSIQTSGSYEDLNIVEHTPPKYPHYSTKDARLKTFKTLPWPQSTPQDVTALVDAGFFYTGSNDNVICFHCGGGLKGWEEDDIPFEEHARWFPRCSFVILNKGREYVDKAKLHKPPVIQQPMESVSSLSEISESELDILMQSDVAKEVLTMGLERHKVREALRQRWNHVHYNFPTANALASAALELRDVIPPPQHATDPTPLVNGNGHLLSQSVASGSGVTANGNPADPDNQLAPSNGMLKRKGDLSVEQEFRLCKLCMDNEMSVVFLPCGHFVACSNCAASLATCPVCRAEIKGSVRTYLP